MTRCIRCNTPILDLTETDPEYCLPCLAREREKTREEIRAALRTFDKLNAEYMARAIRGRDAEKAARLVAAH